MAASHHRRLLLLGRHIAGAAQLTDRKHLSPHVTVEGKEEEEGNGLHVATSSSSSASSSSSSVRARVLLQTTEDAAASPASSGAAFKADFSGKAGQITSITGDSRLVVVGLGPAASVTPEILRAAVARAVGVLKSKRVDAAVLSLRCSLPASLPLADGAFHAAMAATLADHSFDLYVSPAEHSTTTARRLHHLSSIAIEVPAAAPASQQEECKAACARANAISSSQCLVRDLANTRADVADPAFIEARARALVQAHAAAGAPITLRVVDYKEMESKGMGLILGVGRGAAVPPRLVILEYKGGGRGGSGGSGGSGGRSAATALVGKGITYDTGGLNIKGTGSMETMYLDKHGAMSVLGAMDACAKLRLPTNVVGVLALAENSVDALSQHPHDIVSSMSGKTVHIDNTDAEGRLVLADAMTLLQREYPAVDTIVDLATLTGACMMALGRYAAGLWSNSDALVAEVQAAAASTHDERVWHMPLFDEYTAELKHPMCDIKHTGKTRYGGACTAAAFLHAFVEDGRDWCHLDIAGCSGSPVGNGWGVQTLVALLDAREERRQRRRRQQ
eukprot:g5742.t1